MKILQLNNRVPFPLNDGGNLAVNSISKGYLNAGVNLSMLAMNTTRHWVNTDQLPDHFKKLFKFKTVKVDNRIKPLAALLNLFKKSSYNIDRFISKGYEDELIHLLKEENYDIIQLESLFLTPYLATIRKYSNAKVVIRQHNVEFTIWERMAEREDNILKKWYFSLLAKRLKAFEITHLNEYDLILAISKEDEAIFKSLHAKTPIIVQPFTIDIENVPFVPYPSSEPSLYHIGAMDWLPNQESVSYFLDKIMPKVTIQFPNLKLYLAGRNMPEYYLKNQWKNVIVLGEVRDAATFEKDKNILVVPLKSGGGIRVKILQAMAMGKAIVTTSIGVAGIEAKDNVEVMIADSATQFVEKIATLIQHPEKAKAMGLAARKLIEEKYNSKKMIAQLLNHYETLIEQ